MSDRLRSRSPSDVTPEIQSSQTTTQSHPQQQVINNQQQQQHSVRSPQQHSVRSPQLQNAQVQHQQRETTPVQQSNNGSPLNQVNNSLKVNEEEILDQALMLQQQKIAENNNLLAVYQQLGLTTSNVAQSPQVQTSLSTAPSPGNMNISTTSQSQAKSMEFGVTDSNSASNQTKPVLQLNPGGSVNTQHVLGGQRHNTYVQQKTKTVPPGMNNKGGDGSTRVHQNPVHVSNQIPPSPSVSGPGNKINKDNVVLEGGGQFEEGQLYVTKDKKGQGQTMQWRHGDFVPVQNSNVKDINEDTNETGGEDREDFRNNRGVKVSNIETTKERHKQKVKQRFYNRLEAINQQEESLQTLTRDYVHQARIQAEDLLSTEDTDTLIQQYGSVEHLLDRVINTFKLISTTAKDMIETSEDTSIYTADMSMFFDETLAFNQTTESGHLEETFTIKHAALKSSTPEKGDHIKDSADSKIDLQVKGDEPEERQIIHIPLPLNFLDIDLPEDEEDDEDFNPIQREEEEFKIASRTRSKYPLNEVSMTDIEANLEDDEDKDINEGTNETGGEDREDFRNNRGVKVSSEEGADVLDDDELPEDNMPLREQDRLVLVIMKKSIPKSLKIAKDAKERVQECLQECFQEYVSEFISIITSKASERCHQEKRRTINGEDVLFTMSTPEVDSYVEPVKAYLQKYRESMKGEKSVGGEGDMSGLGVDGTYEMGGDPVNMDNGQSPKAANSPDFERKSTESLLDVFYDVDMNNNEDAVENKKESEPAQRKRSRTSTE